MIKYYKLSFNQWWQLRNGKMVLFKRMNNFFVVKRSDDRHYYIAIANRNSRTREVTAISAFVRTTKKNLKKYYEITPVLLEQC